MQKFSQRVFKGLSTDISVEDISELATPLCQDVCVTPRGALSTPLGMTKWNTQSLGFINGGFDYRGRVGQYVLSFASTAGAGYPSGGGVGTTGGYVPGTITGTSYVDGSTRAGGPPVRAFTSLSVSIPANTNNGEAFAITVTALDQFGSVFDKSGTVSLSDNGTGYLSPGSLTMVNGVATGTTTYNNIVAGTESVTVSGSISLKTGTATMTAHGYYVEWDLTYSAVIPNIYGMSCGVDTSVRLVTGATATIKRNSGSVATEVSDSADITLSDGGHLYDPSEMGQAYHIDIASGTGTATNTAYYTNSSDLTDHVCTVSCSIYGITSATTFDMNIAYIYSTWTVTGTYPNYHTDVQHKRLDGSNSSYGNGTANWQQVVGPSVTPTSGTVTNGSASWDSTKSAGGSAGGWGSGKNSTGGAISVVY